MKRLIISIAVLGLYLIVLCGCTGNVVSLFPVSNTTIPEMTIRDTESSSSGVINTTKESNNTDISLTIPTTDPSFESAAKYLQIDYNPYLLSPRSIELFGDNTDVLSDFYNQYIEDVIDGRPDRDLPDVMIPLLSRNHGLHVFQRIHPLQALVRDSHYNLEDTHIIREFHFDAEEHERQVELIANRVEEIITSTIREDFNQLEATLALYHYLSMNSTYLECEFSSTYGILVDSQGVCTGFTGALRHLLLQAGYDDGYSIQYQPADGTSGHVWNMININGEWYHFDITWENSSGAKNLLYYFGMTDAERADPSLAYYTMELADDMPIPACTDESFLPLRDADEFVFNLEEHAVYIIMATGEWVLWNTQDMTFSPMTAPE